MLSLFENRLAPLTLSIGFLEATASSFTENYLRWKKSHFKSIEILPTQENLQASLRRLEPLTIPPRRFLIFSTDSKWTAYFDNSTNGPDAFPPISYLAEKMSCRGLIATSIPHTLNSDIGQGRGTYGTVRFELFGPSQKEFLNYERLVEVAFDGNWRFNVRGSVQLYEECAQYSAPKIIDRFTPQLLQRYCEALGIRVFDDTFYVGPGTLIVVRDLLPSGCKESTLEEARQKLGFT